MLHLALTPCLPFGCDLTCEIETVPFFTILIFSDTFVLTQVVHFDWLDSQLMQSLWEFFGDYMGYSNWEIFDWESIVCPRNRSIGAALNRADHRYRPTGTRVDKIICDRNFRFIYQRKKKERKRWIWEKKILKKYYKKKKLNKKIVINIIYQWVKVSEERVFWVWSKLNTVMRFWFWRSCENLVTLLVITFRTT